MSYTKLTRNAAEAAEIIADGRIAAFPTGTSYGLAADCLQGFALQRLRNSKGRPNDKTFTVFADESLWDKYFDLSAGERRLLTAMSGRALTLLVKPKQALEHLAQAGRVGLRVIDHPLMRDLAQATLLPLTATSANISGQPACYDPACVLKNFPGKLTPDLPSLNPEDAEDIRVAQDTTYNLSLGAILDGGALPRSLPSTIARVIADQGVEIIREGQLSKADIMPF